MSVEHVCESPSCAARITIPETTKPDKRAAFMYRAGWRRVEDGYVCPRCVRQG